MKTPPPSARRRGGVGGTLLAACALMTTASCGARTDVRNPFDGSAERERAERLRIQVQNLNFNDVTVYAVSSGQRIRLGTVTGKTDSTYTIPWNFANPIEFEIDVVGGRGCITQPLAVEPAARVWVQIPGDTGMSPCRSGRG